ncbi:hypothetical protein T484DRAFT_1837658, partial [Baffinella frigidus]
TSEETVPKKLSGLYPGYNKLSSSRGMNIDPSPDTLPFPPAASQGAPQGVALQHAEDTAAPISPWSAAPQGATARDTRVQGPWGMEASPSPRAVGVEEEEATRSMGGDVGLAMKPAPSAPLVPTVDEEGGGEGREEEEEEEEEEDLSARAEEVIGARGLRYLQEDRVGEVGGSVPAHAMEIDAPDTLPIAPDATLAPATVPPSRPVHEVTSLVHSAPKTLLPAPPPSLPPAPIVLIEAAPHGVFEFSSGIETDASPDTLPDAPEANASFSPAATEAPPMCVSASKGAEEGAEEGDTLAAVEVEEEEAPRSTDRDASLPPAPPTPAPFGENAAASTPAAASPTPAPIAASTPAAPSAPAPAAASLESPRRTGVGSPSTGVDVASSSAGGGVTAPSPGEGAPKSTGGDVPPATMHTPHSPPFRAALPSAMMPAPSAPLVPTTAPQATTPAPAPTLARFGFGAFALAPAAASPSHPAAKEAKEAHVEAEARSWAPGETGAPGGRAAPSSSPRRTGGAAPSPDKGLVAPSTGGDASRKDVAPSPSPGKDAVAPRKGGGVAAPSSGEDALSTGGGAWTSGDALSASSLWEVVSTLWGLGSTLWELGPTLWEPTHGEHGPTLWGLGHTPWDLGHIPWDLGPTLWEVGSTLWDHDPTRWELGPTLWGLGHTLGGLGPTLGEPTRWEHGPTLSAASLSHFHGGRRPFRRGTRLDGTDA